MKKIFIALFVCSVALVGCNNNQERTCYAEFKLLTNPDACSYISFGFFGDVCLQGDISSGVPVPIGTTCTSESYLFAKGANISAGCVASGSTTNTFTNNHQCEIKLYVDGNLEETRISSGLTYINFIIP